MSNSNMLDYTRTLYPEIEPYETGMLDVGEALRHRVRDI